MHAGQQLKVSCPSYLAYGGTPKYGHYNLDLIPADSPLVFELDVLECQQGIDKINEVNKKAKNNAPWVYRHGKHGPRGGPGSGGDGDGAEKPDAEEAPHGKKDMAKIKQKVTKMKKTISKQKKRLKKDEDETKKMENEIEKGEAKD
jgi:FKBP-type peptidyl-prolyl cis-trans isomerase